MVDTSVTVFSAADDEVPYDCWYAGLVVRDLGGGEIVVRPTRYKGGADGPWETYTGVREILARVKGRDVEFVDTWPRRKAVD